MKLFRILLLFIFISCLKNDEIKFISKNPEPDSFLNSVEISNSDTLSSINYMYYTDSISLLSILPNFNENVEYTVSDPIFSIKNKKLYIVDPYNIKKTIYQVKILNNGEIFNIVIKVRCWIKDKYEFKEVLSDSHIKFVYTQGDSSFYIKNDSLFLQHKTNKSIFYSKLPVLDNMYNQFMFKFGFYAYRTNNNIFVSNDLKNWELIFSGPRGIKESILIVKNTNGYELLFTEYTPGVIYTRHNLWAYNLITKQLRSRKLFYKTEEFISNGLTPHARHIHFLSQDPYSNIIFMGTGDLDSQSSIYYSTDNGINFKVLGMGSQYWRSLSMLYFKDNIYWTMDSSSPQFLLQISRSNIFENSKLYNLFPLINSALWCSQKIYINNKEGYLISQNAEGQLYDKLYRVFLIIEENNKPIAYQIFANTAISVYDQIYPVGLFLDNSILFYSIPNNKFLIYKISKIL